VIESSFFKIAAAPRLALPGYYACAGTRSTPKTFDIVDTDDTLKRS